VLVGTTRLVYRVKSRPDRVDRVTSVEDLPVIPPPSAG
jgi:hypothetical protein